MVCAMFAANTTDGSTAQYYTLVLGFDDLSGAMLFPFSDKIFDALKYFGLKLLVLCTGSDTARTALLVHRCSEFDWAKAAVQD